MKLVELLAMELKEWPSVAKCMAQNSDALVVMLKSLDVIYRNEIWVGADGDSIVGFRNLSELATDHATAIVTRADWEAEKARIAGKVDGGWKRNRGGKMPVSEGTKVDVRHRDGCIYHGLTAGEGMAANWGHSKHPEDIMVFRIHNPAEQPAPVSEEAIQVDIDAADAGKLTPIAEVKARIPSLKTERALKDAREGNTAKFSSIDELMQDLGESMPQPIAWRNRIYELDTQRAELEATYQRQIGEIDGEREGLVGKLASEGLALVEDVQPAEDMDWRKWRKGDVVMCVSQNHKWSEEAEPGAKYRLSEDPSQDDEDGLNILVAGLYMNPADFKFVSRPGK